MAEHELWLTDDKGARIALLDDFIRFEGTRSVNTVGQCRLFLPSTFDTSLLRIDRMIQLWRAPAGGRLSLWRPFLIQRARYEMLGQKETIMVGGEDPITLLKRRNVIGYKGSSEASKSGPLDDVMKEYVLEAMVSSGHTTGFGSRDYTGLTVQTDLSRGYDTLYEAAYKNVFDVLREISRANVAYDDTDLFFDVVPTFVTGKSISFEFRTYVGQIGADLSDRVVFDQAYGNFTNPFYESDWSDVQSYVYVGGQGSGALRRIYEIYDKARLYVSKWAWREGWTDARSADSNDAIQAEGFRALQSGRPIMSFGGQPVDTDETQYDVDWHFGDLVRARYRDIDEKCMVVGVTLTIEKKRETINTDLRVVSSELQQTDSILGGWEPEEEPE